MNELLKGILLMFSEHEEPDESEDVQLPKFPLIGGTKSTGHRQDCCTTQRCLPK